MEIVYQAPFLNGFFNILSLLLGICALVFVIHSLHVKGCLICCTISGGLCGLALLCQLLELNRLAQIKDWSAIQDTIGARVAAAVVLLAVTVVLNILALLRSKQK